LTELQLAQFRDDGFITLPRLFGAADVNRIREAFMDANRQGPVLGLSEIKDEYKPEDPLSRYPRMMHPHRHPELAVGPIAMQYMLHPRLHAVLKALMGEEPYAVQSMFYFKPPGARGQALHQDNFYLRVKPGTCMAAWLAIDDADEENGGMMCVPETSDHEIACPAPADASQYFTTHYVAPPDGKKPMPINLQAGDVLFFNGSVIHGSNPNTSATRFRRSLIFHYVPAGTRELSSWYLDPLSFDQQIHAIPNSEGGGPCGDVQTMTAPH
jgi:phytanoyl-CoA hydroxylase